jgi:hypothetical protein
LRAVVVRPVNPKGGSLSVSEGSRGHIGLGNAGKNTLVNIARLIRIVFGTVAGVMLVASLADILWFGQLTLISPFSFGALLR